MSQRTVYIETFGCQMNELDSELVAGQLRALGYRFTADVADANVVLYNTCSVREHAEQRVWSRLGELALRKNEDPGLVVGVLGCMAERDGVDLVRRMPVVDVLVGPGELDKLPGLLDNAVRTRESMISQSEDVAHDLAIGRFAKKSARQVALQGNTSRRSATLAAAQDSLEMLDLSRSVSPIDSEIVGGEGQSKRSAYVRITRGCNKFCTYCVVPFTRGAEIHRPPDHIVEECKKLADAGVIEITLLGQTVNHYRFEHGSSVTVDGIIQPQKGRAFTGGHRRDPLAGQNTTTFADLLRRIHDEVPSIQRLRFVTSYPRDFGDDVLEVIRDHPRICRYLHIPAQSGSDRMLQMMNRGYTVGEYLEFMDRCRHYLDEPHKGRPLTMSGDFIVGFPTETDEDFAKSVELLEKARYKNAFIFKYSPRPGTIAFDKLADDVPEAVKRQRNNEMLAIQMRISDEISREQIGREFDVLVEGLSRKEEKRRKREAAPGMVSLTIGGQSSTSDACGDDHDCGCSTKVAAVSTSDAPVQLSARTDSDLIVFVDAPAGRDASEFVGTIQRVRVNSATNLSLHGEMI